MKKPNVLLGIILILSAYILFTSFRKDNVYEEGYVLIHEKDIAVEQEGPHDGGGKTIAMPFFEKDAKRLVFRKRILHPGSSIGYHLQQKEEIYYILQGNGTMKMNGKTFPITAGDAILTHPGNWHGLTPDEDNDLALIINYEIN